MKKFQIEHLGKKINMRLHVKSDAISGQIVTHNTFFEIGFLEFLRTKYGTQRSIIDVGANIGNHAVFFSEYLEHDKIYCFEPDEDNLEILKDNMANKNCEIFDVALSDHDGTATLYNCDPGNSGAFSLEVFDSKIAEGSQHRLSKSYVAKYNVPIRTLDSYNLQNISMIKIDVENHELPVLEGAKQTILNNKPIVIFEDLHYLFPYFPAGRFDAFFKSVNYVRVESNIAGSYTDLWAPAF